MHHADLIYPQVCLDPRPGTCKGQHRGIRGCVVVENPEPVVALSAAAGASFEARAASRAAEGGVELAGRVVDAACCCWEDLSCWQSAAVNG